MKLKRTLILAGLAGSLIAGSAFAAQPQEQEKDKPEAAAPAKGTAVNQEQARAIALEKVPGGKLSSEEAKRVKDQLIYSFEFEVPEKKGVEVVTVAAATGEVMAVTHKDPWQVRRDAKSKRRRT
ncbi:MAG TPA: PepSY domain-containing protein [Thermoanaerobaculia bacterium]|nr:PepSY domain-containing protein [Thermoanaerobaculia bacterium]